jgi:predicted SAM-dependent methyltransferase
MKINMGCGKRNFGSDWIHIDGGDHDHLDYHDITNLKFQDNSVDLIYSSHVVEYFSRDTIGSVLKEWKRVLKPGATLRVAVPDFEAMCYLYSKGSYSLGSFLGPLYGKMPMGEQTIFHKTTYDFVSLKETLEESGFSDVKRYDWKHTEHSDVDDHSQAYLPHMDKESGTLISLNVECIK